MQNALAPAWAESFQPSPAAIRQSFLPAFGWSDGMTPAQTARAMEGRIGGMVNPNEQLRSFTGWNYVYVHRFATAFSSLQWMLGRERKADANELDGGNPVRTQHIRQHYRICQAESMTFDTIQSHPVLDLLERPNPMDTAAGFLYETALYESLTGEFFWWVVRNGLRRPVEIYALARNMMRPVFKNVDHGEVIRYEITIDNAPVQKIDPDDVVWFRRKNPFSKVEPYSPTMAGASWVTAERQIETSRAVRFANGGAPDVYLKIDGDRYGREVDDSLLDRLSLKLKQRLGMRNTHGGTIPLPPGIEPVKMSETPREMDWGSSLKDTRDSLGALRGMNKVSVGITEDMNRADTITGMQQFYSLALNPFAATIAGVATNGLLPMYDRRYQAKGVFLYFPDVTPVDPAEEREEQKLDWEMGAASPNDRRKRRGMPPKEGPEYESGYITSSVIPLDSEAEKPVVSAAAPGANGQQQPVDDPTEVDDGADTYGQDAATKTE